MESPLVVGFFFNSRQDVMCHFIISSQASFSCSLILNWLVFPLISTKGVVFIDNNLFPILTESLRGEPCRDLKSHRMGVKLLR